MSSWQPRQRRAVETRRRILDAALAEMGRVGVEAARIEDIVAAAGVSWGSFYRYFPAKEDVLLETAATVAQVFADAGEIGAASGRPIPEVLVGAFWRAASAAPTSPPLWEATFRALAERPEQLGPMLADRHIPPPEEVLAGLIDTGQRRGELRDDHPASLLAAVILPAVWANALREGPAGVMTTRLPRAGGGARTSRRRLAVTLLVDGLSRHGGGGEAAARGEGSPPAEVPERLGRRRAGRASPRQPSSHPT